MSSQAARQPLQVQREKRHTALPAREPAKSSCYTQLCERYLVKYFLGVIVLLALAAAFFFQPNQASRANASLAPLDLFQRYVAAVNAGDLNGALAVFSDDASISVGGLGAAVCPNGVCTGRAAIRALLQGQIADQQQITLMFAETAPDRITLAGRVSVRSRQAAAAGRDLLIFNFQLAEVSGLIAKVTLVPDDATGRFLQQREVAPFQPPRTGDGGILSSR